MVQNIRSDASETSGARYINMIVGAWVFVSAFLWTHSTAQFHNAWIVGLLCVGFAATALRYPQARYGNALLAVWLFISAFALPTITNATIWNSVIAAIVMFAAAMVPDMMEARSGGRVGRGARVDRPARV